ncbi:uncharacterized protein LOC131307972 [Rhododendron vialii]|uniref:uncharacterized protein LOC131307972 n=1 Tax=Rhododendron vialii TaxID=182163 RepID=UPI00265F2B18|nr:uncharacterized protein LOC131307972 [Rhododendron vialii]
MLSNNKKFGNNNLCVHPFCNECITKYVQSKNEEERVAGIKCPGSNCDKLLDPLTCRALVPPEVSDRCYCPNRVCSAMVVKECGGIVKKSMCPNCKHCVEHVHGCSILTCRCGRSFSYECGRKVHQH